MNWLTGSLHLLVGAFGVALSSAPAYTQGNSQAFEGIVTMRATLPAPQGAQTQSIDYLVRGGKMRVNLPGGAMSVLVVPQEAKAYLLMDAQSSYSELALPARDASAPGTPALPSVSLSRTGRRETIAGHSCEHVIVTARTDTLDVCLTSELGPYVNPMALMRGNTNDPMQRALAEGGFPLRVVRGKGDVMMEVTQVTRRRLDNAQFTVPLAYTRMELPRRR